MKKDLHPTLHKDARVTCTSCGAVYQIPGTVKIVQTEICSNCHPVYTGKYRAVTGSGRVERFRKKVEAAKVASATKKAKRVETEEEKFAKRVQEVSLERKVEREQRQEKEHRKKIAEAKKIVVKGTVRKESKEGKVGSKKPRKKPAASRGKGKKD